MRFRNENVLVQEPIIDVKPFGIHAYDGDITVGIVKGTKSGISINLYYSFDRLNWNVFNYSSQTIQVESGKTVYFYGPSTNRFSIGEAAAERSYFTFGGQGKVKLVGQLLSLINPNWAFNKTMQAKRYNLAYLFYNAKQIYDASELHINCDTIKCSDTYNVSFGHLLHNCSNLQHGLKFDAQTLTTQNTATFITFYTGCSSLLDAEIPPIINSTSRCLESFFSKCSSLNKIISRSTVNINYTSFSTNLPTSGTFYNLNNGPYTTGTTGIPAGWNTYSSKIYLASDWTGWGASDAIEIEYNDGIYETTIDATSSGWLLFYLNNDGTTLSKPLYSNDAVCTIDNDYTKQYYNIDTQYYGWNIVQTGTWKIVINTLDWSIEFTKIA